MCKDADILLVQWCDTQKDGDDIGEIDMLLKASLFNGDEDEQALKAPFISTLLIESPDILIMSQKLRLFLVEHKSIQVLYFSCHGTDKGLSFKGSGVPYISYADFATLLKDHIDPDNCLCLIMGSCESMHPSHRLEDKMPLVVNWVKGFEGCPCGPEVAALAASHIQDDVTLMTDLSTANELVCGKGIPIDDFSNVISSMKRTVEKHVENPIREIKKREGHAVIVATRNDVTKEWSRSYFPLI